MSVLKLLRRAEDAWRDVETPENEGGQGKTLPDGKYRVEITGAELKQDKNGGHGILFQFEVTKGEHEGAKQSKWMGLLDENGKLLDEDRIKWVKKEFAVLLGEPLEDLAEIEDVLGDLLGKTTEIFIKENDKGYTNVYINAMAKGDSAPSKKKSIADEDEDEDEEPKKKVSRREVEDEDEEEEKPLKKSRVEEEDEDEDEEPKSKKKSKSEDEDEDEDEDADAEVERLLNKGKSKTKSRR